MSGSDEQLLALEKRIADLEAELYEVRQVAYGTRYSIKSSATHKGYLYNLLKPMTLNSRIHWLAVNYWPNHPLRYHMQDKYLFKYYFSKLYGEQYTVPTLGVWDSADYIDFDALPANFVIKRTIGGGAREVRIVDKTTTNLEELRQTASRWANDKLNAPARILAEPVLPFEGTHIVDYKFYVFRGKAKLILVAQANRETNERSRNFFNLDWQKYEIKGQGLEKDVPRPDNLEEMIAFAERVGTHFPMIRVDFYNFGDHFVCGELTTLPFNGYGPYGTFDKPWGQMMDLPDAKQIAADYEIALKDFPELVDNPVFLKDRGPRHRLILPNSLDGALPTPPANFLQPNDLKVSIL